MVSVLSILIWIVVIVGIVKGFSGNDSKKTQPTQNSTQKTVQQFKSGAQKIISEISAYADAAEQGTSTGNKTSYNQTQRSYNAQQNAYAQPKQQKRQMTAAERAKLDAYRQQKAAAKSAQPNNIVDRAKQNANKYAEDTTIEQLEKEHKHSERESKAEAAYVAKEREEHRKLHTEPIPPVEEESLLGSVQDLMIKGYDGNLSFERDFVGEAMDLLNSFTVQ
jgi:FtsZ-interacting cell division protein ZipA